MAIRSLVACLAALLVAGSSQAQGVANSLQELRLLIQVGDTVRVTNLSGQVETGRVAVLSAPMLVLSRGDGRVTIDESDIATVSHRRSDPLGNGALWGMGIAAGFVGITLAAAGDVDTGFIVGATAAYAAIGAGIGVGIAALIKKRTVVFERQVPTGARLQVSPIVTPRAAGARVALAF